LDLSCASIVALGLKKTEDQYIAAKLADSRCCAEDHAAKRVHPIATPAQRVHRNDDDAAAAAVAFGMHPIARSASFFESETTTVKGKKSKKSITR
jgi:hypothetical protein